MKLHAMTESQKRNAAQQRITKLLSLWLFLNLGIKRTLLYLFKTKPCNFFLGIKINISIYEARIHWTAIFGENAPNKSQDINS